MSDFSEGDDVFFFFTERGRYGWSDATLVYPCDIHLLTGKIVFIDEEQDTIHVYVRNEREVVSFGYVFRHDYIFKTRDNAVDALHKKMVTL